VQPLKKVEQINRSANPKQRVLLAVLVPIGILLIGYGIMRILNANSWDLVRESSFCDPTELDESWWGWLIVVVIIGVYEWKLFGLGNMAQMTTVSGAGSSHVMAVDETTGEQKYVGSYVENAKGDGGTAVFGKDATATTVIQMFLMHIADKAPDSTKAAFCSWAGLTSTQFTARHRALFANAFLHYLQELRMDGMRLPREYEALMPDLMNQKLEPLPRPLTPEFKEQIHAIFFGR
jgi:hypothetical protein